MSNRAGRKRLSIDIPDQLHYELQKHALKYRITVTQCVIREIIEMLKRQKQYEV